MIKLKESLEEFFPNIAPSLTKNIKKAKMRKRFFTTPVVLFMAMILAVFAGIGVLQSAVNSNARQQFSSKGLAVAALDYSESTKTLLNPERGFYRIREVEVPNPYNIDMDTTLDGALDSLLRSVRRSEQTLTHLQINLKNFVGDGNEILDSPIHQQGLEQIQRAFDLVRKNGLKAIVRIVYDTDGAYAPEPYEFDMILAHLDQLKPILTANQDVIYVAEAGMIGKYGEWHGGKYNTIQERSQLIDKLLEVFPQTTSIALRRPLFYKDKFGALPANALDVYNQTDLHRISMHNDAFLASETDMGTYSSNQREKELVWLEQHTKHTIFGGEAINAQSMYSNLENAIEEMQRTHCQYLNATHDVAVKNQWKNSIYMGDNQAYSGQSGYNYIEDHLGYRYVLRKSQLPKVIKKTDNLNISLEIENVGFGNLYSERKVELVLEKDDQLYIAPINTDPRFWNAGEQTGLELLFQLPSEIEAGNWNLYIQLPDSSSTLNTDTKYSVQFANNMIWNAKLGANYIGTVQIKSSNQSASTKEFVQLN